MLGLVKIIIQFKLLKNKNLLNYSTPYNKFLLPVVKPTITLIVMLVAKFGSFF
jgi:hypothetical protein